MVIARTHPILGHLRRCIGPPQVTLPDGDLLESHVQGGSEAAFAGLVERHGPMILAVCRAVLGHRDDAEDAFQATFLVLARKADSIRRRESVGSWLHGVAFRIARKARVARARQQVLEAKATVPEPVESADDLSWAEVRAILHAELGLLPERFRKPLVLVYLEGLTQEDAACRLGWTTATVKGRVQRGRDQLRRRLEHRGLGLTAALGATVTSQALSGPVSPALMEAPVRTGVAVGGGTVSSSIASLASVVVEPFIRLRFFGMAMVLLLSAAFAAGFAFWPREPAEPELDASAAQAAAPRLDTRTDRYGDPLPDAAVARLGTVRYNHPSQLNALQFTSDGTTIISDGDGHLCLWDVATGKLLKQLARPNSSLLDPMVFLPDGRTMVFLTINPLNDTVRVWDLEQGKEVRAVPLGVIRNQSPNYFPWSALSADGRWCAIRTDSQIQVFETATGNERYQIPKTANEVEGFVFGGNDQLIVADKQGIVTVGEARTGKPVQKIVPGGPVKILAASPEGRWLATIAGAKDPGVPSDTSILSGPFHK